MKIINHLKGLVKNENVCKRNLINTVRANSTVKWDSAKPFEEIPSVTILPLIGTMWQSFPIIGRYDPNRRYQANKDKKKRLGNIFREKFGSLDVVLSFTVEDLESVLRSEGMFPISMELSSVKTYRESRKNLFSTKGLLVLQGREWYDLRTKTQKHLLKPMAVYEYIEPLHMVGRDFAKRILQIRDENLEVPDLHKEIRKFSLESVAFVGLDTRLGCLRSDLRPNSDATKMVESAMTALECEFKLEAFTGFIPFWRIFSTPTWRKFEKASDVFTELSFKYVKEALKEISYNTKNKKKLTLLQAMLANKDLSVADAVVVVSDLMLAGIETTSLAAGFLLYHLARNPEKQYILYQEVMRLLPNQDVKMNTEIFQDFKYLKACWMESMRLTPIVPAFARILAQDTVLSGYRVRAGTVAGVFYDDIYMDEKIYKNATQFLPERWLDRNTRPPRFAFMPFSFGTRSCIGRRLAEIKTVCLISEILRKFKIEYHYEDIGIFTKMLNVPDKPLRFKFIER